MRATDVELRPRRCQQSLHDKRAVRGAAMNGFSPAGKKEIEKVVVFLEFHPILGDMGAGLAVLVAIVAKTLAMVCVGFGKYFYA